jgi:hypothetical protein
VLGLVQSISLVSAGFVQPISLVSAWFVQPIYLVSAGACPAHISCLGWDLSSPYLVPLSGDVQYVS